MCGSTTVQVQMQKLLKWGYVALTVGWSRHYKNSSHELVAHCEISFSQMVMDLSLLCRFLFRLLPDLTTYNTVDVL
jgi:hypothetical protein